MSQSDYILYKKTQQVLKEQNKLSPVIMSKDYTEYSKYAVETTISNTKLKYSKLVPPNKVDVLDMEKTITNCPTFVLCKNTDQRPNRVNNTFSNPPPTFKVNKVYTPTLCTFTNDSVTRVVPCSKKICKCKTTIYTQ